MPAEIHFSEPHIHTGPWAVLLLCLLILLATVGPALIVADLRDERRSAEWARKVATKAHAAVGEAARHVSLSHRTYKPRHRPVLPPPKPDAARVRIITAAGRRVVAAVRRDGGVRA